MIKRYKKRGDVLAVQVCWKNWDSIIEILREHKFNSGFTGDAVDDCDELNPYIELAIELKNGRMYAKHGQYIVKRADGRLSIHDPKVFHEAYEEA